MTDTHMETKLATYRTPRWVKIFGVIVIVLILLVAIVFVTGLGGEHGPGRHAPSGDASDNTPLIQQEAQGDGPIGLTPPVAHSEQQP